MKKKNVSLPDKLSDLLALALRDMRAVKKLKSRVFDMDCFHYVRADGKCAMCMAGAVMDRTLGVSLHETCGPSNYDSRTSNKLWAIDSMRAGDARPVLYDSDKVCDTLKEFNTLVKKHWRRRLKRAPLSVYDKGVEILRAAGF